MELQLRVEGPLDAAATLERFHIWGEDPANRLGECSLRRVLSQRGQRIPYEARWSGAVDDVRLDITVAGSRRADLRAAITAEIRRVFGLDFDLPAFYRFAARERVLAMLVEPLRGFRPTLAPRPFEMLVGAITAQQVNLTFASTCRSRLVRAYGTPVPYDDEVIFAFPEAEALASVPVAALRALQFSTRKAEYIRDLAQQIVSGGLDLERFATATNDEVLARITALRGLGRWTGEWFLARWAGRGDVCVAGDLAVRKVFQHCFGDHLDEDGVRKRAARWGEHQNLAVHYLLAGMRRGLLGECRG